MEVPESIKSQLKRANEFFDELKLKVKQSLENKLSVEDLKNVAADLLNKLRSPLDHAMRCAFEKYFEQDLEKEELKKVKIYFPIVPKADDLRASLGRSKMLGLETHNKNLYDFLESVQAYTAPQNKWLGLLNDYAVEGKHIDLVPVIVREKKIIDERVNISHSGGGAVEWSRKATTFGPGVSVLGAPIDPISQMPIATPEHNVKIIYVETTKGYNLPHGQDIIVFFKECIEETDALIKEFFKLI